MVCVANGLPQFGPCVIRVSGAGPCRAGAIWGLERSAEWMREGQPEVEPYCACTSCACCGSVVRAAGVRALPGRPCARALPGRGEASRAGPGQAGAWPGPIYTMRTQSIDGSSSRGLSAGVCYRGARSRSRASIAAASVASVVERMREGPRWGYRCVQAGAWCVVSCRKSKSVMVM